MHSNFHRIYKKDHRDSLIILRNIQETMNFKILWLLLPLTMNVLVILATNTSVEQGSNGLETLISPNVTQMESRFQRLEDDVMKVTKDLQSLSGTVFTRWGRKTCPANGTEMLYWGFVGGSWYEHTGGAADKLCLPSDPVLDSSLGTGGNAEIHGAEYRNTFTNKAKSPFDVPCAVCRATSRSSVVMIPGRNICYPGWTMEYYGIIAAGSSISWDDPSILVQFLYQRNKEHFRDYQEFRACAKTSEHNDTVSPNITQVETRLQSLEERVKEISDNTKKKFAGSVYARWGRKTCPGNGTEILYWGFVGGSSYEHTGAAADKLCLPSDPVLDSSLGTGGNAEIHGAEYDVTFSEKAKYPFDVPCAVCRATSRSSAVMIPGRNICYPGWTMEYYGIIAAGANSHKAATEYVCIDSDAEAVNHSNDRDYGYLFYHVTTKCTSLPCPPYKDNWRIPCVVCTI